MNTQTNTPVWNIHDLNLTLDLEDVQTMERYEHAFQIMQEDEKNLPKDGKTSEIIKPYCMMFYHLYDNLFEVGTGMKIFKGHYNARECDEVYESFLAFISEYSKAVNDRRNAMVGRYNANRAQRRALQRNKKL